MTKNNFKAGDRVQLTEEALRRFSGYSTNPFGTILFSGWLGVGMVKTEYGDELWDLKWWQTPEQSRDAWLERRARDHLIVRQ